MQDSLLHIGFLQYDIAWEDPEKNRNIIEGLLSKSDCVSLDIIVLPEMFTTGFSMNVESISESHEGPTYRWMQMLAEKYQINLTGSIVVREEDRYYNRLYWLSPDGTAEYYDKKHLFKLAGEHHHFTAGDSKLTLEVSAKDGGTWKICPLICYDLRFPVWSRNVEQYDVLIYVANFPEKRSYAWKQLLIARAIENQSYTIGANRIGVDGIEIPYSGDSMVIDYEGRPMVKADSQEGLFVAELSYKKLQTYRRAYNFLRDQDTFKILS